MKLFSERIINLWNKYEVRAIILLSLVLQIILIILGNRRKLTARFWIRIIVWSAYLSADWVATVALGNLASSIGDSEDSTPVPNNALQEFWAPFLLLHLGGPDTITAYSLEDNELWLRHFIVLIIQVGVAFYVFLRSWGNTALTFLTIPIFISGVIKYGERTYTLMSSSSEHFKDFLPSSPDTCQEFVKYVDDQDIRGKREEGSEEPMVIPQDGIRTEDHYLVLANYLFIRTKFFFAERTLNSNEQKRIYSIIKNKQTAEAFKLVAVELGFMYDMLHTKAAIVYSHLGIVFRCITFFSSVCSLVVFSTIIDTHVYPLVDISITYFLLVGAVLLELYALILLLLSDWGKLWLIKLKKAQHNPISKTLADLFWKFSSHSQSLLTGNKRWSESMGQYSLLSSCIKDVQPAACFGVQKLPFIRKWLKNMYLTRVDVNVDHLQETIVEYLKEQGSKVNKEDVSNRERDIFLTRRGYSVIEERHKILKQEAMMSILSLEFVDSVIIWHIATDICYYGDLDDKHGDVTKLDPRCKIGKCLSDYMCYLLVFRPSMLPKGIGEVRYKETCAEVTTHFKQKGDNDIDICSEISKAYEALLQKNEEVLKPLMTMFELGWWQRTEFFDMKGSLSLLKYGCLLYRLLQRKVRDYLYYI